MSIAGLLALALLPQPQTVSDVSSRFVERTLAAYEALDAGELDRAKQLFTANLERFPEHANSAYALACVAARSGDANAALDWLAKAVQFGYADAEVAAWDSDLAPLRTDARFDELLASMRAMPVATVARARLVWRVSNASARYSQDGTRLATAASDHAAILDSRTDEILAVMDSPVERVTGIGFADQGFLLAVGVQDTSPAYWNAFDGSCVEDAEALAEMRPLPEPSERLGALTEEFLQTRTTIKTPAADPSGAPISIFHEWTNADATRRFRIQRERWIATAGVLLDARSGAELAHFADVGSVHCRGGFSASGRFGWWFDPRIGELHVFDAVAGKELHVLRGSTYRFAAAIADPTRDEVVTLGGGRGLTRWSLQSGKAERQVAFDLKANYGGVCASADTRFVMRCEWGKTIEVWDVLAMERLWSLDATRASRWVFGSAFSGDGERLVLPLGDRLTVYETRTGKRLARLGSPSLDVDACALAPSGSSMVLGLADGSLRRIEFASPGTGAMWQIQGGRVDTCEFLGEGERLLVGWRDGMLAILDGTTGAVLHRIERDLDVDSTDAIATRDGRRIVARVANRERELLAAETGASLAKFGLASWDRTAVIDELHQRIADERTQGVVGFWDVETGAPQAREFETGDKVRSLAFSPDGTVLACGTDDKGLFVWRAEDGALIRNHHAPDVFDPSPDIRAIEFDPDGASVVFTTGDYGTVRRLEIASGDETTLYDPGGGTGSTIHARPSVSGQRIYVHGLVTRGPLVLDAQSGKPLLELGSEYLWSVDGTLDDRWVVGTVEHAVRVFGDELDARYTYIPFDDGGWIAKSESLHCAGTAAALRWAAIVIGDETYPFASFASELLDPKRVRAAAAGVKVRPAKLGTPPKARVVGDAIRALDAGADSVRAEFEFSDALGIAGCELDLDGEALDGVGDLFAALGKSEQPMTVAFQRARRPRDGDSELRLVLYNRAGIGSRPVRVRFIAGR